MKKKQRITVAVVTCGLLFLVAFLGLRLFMGNSRSFNKRRMWTEVSIKHVRNNIQEFQKSQGHYPVSLVQLCSFGKKNMEFEIPDGHRCEFISDESGNKAEHEVLNGKGGWYYNKITGELKVNLTKPIKHYFKFYIGKHRNEIPCEW